jgi:hypothetical protein
MANSNRDNRLIGQAFLDLVKELREMGWTSIEGILVYIDHKGKQIMITPGGDYAPYTSEEYAEIDHAILESLKGE